MKTKQNKIKTLAQFKKLASRPNGVEFFILLNGNLRSSKYAKFNGKDFIVENYIDGSTEARNAALYGSIILEAIDKGCCYEN